MVPDNISAHVLLFISFLIHKLHLNNDQLVDHAFQSVRDNPRDLQVLSKAAWVLKSVVETNNILLKYLADEPQIKEFMERWEDEN